MAAPDFLQPFVLTVPPVEPERRGRVDLYRPAPSQPRPAIVFVHGGPVPAGATPTPREWPAVCRFMGVARLSAKPCRQVSHPGSRGDATRPRVASEGDDPLTGGINDLGDKQR